MFLGRARSRVRPRRTYLPPFVEFPLYGALALIWGGPSPSPLRASAHAARSGCAHVGTVEWFPAFTGCHAGHDATTGLDIRTTCTVLRTAHGTSWLLALGLCACPTLTIRAGG